MADDNKIEFDIVLNDGSTQKVFIKLEQAATKTAKKIEDSFAEKNPLEKLAPQANSSFGDLFKLANSTFGKISVVATTTFLGVKKSIDAAFEGEKLLKIEKQFEALAALAGVSATSIKNDFSAALGGVVDDSRAFEVLNQSLVKTNITASKLSELMLLSRKSVNLFGGDAITNFEAITSAIANGNTRQLKSLGILIDADKAQKDYAKTLGTTSDFLTVGGKQQALLNEVLRVGADRFRSVSVEQGGVTEASKRLSVSLNNLFDDIQKGTAKALGPSFAGAVNIATMAVERTKDVFFSSAKNANQLKEEIGRLEKKLEGLNTTAKGFNNVVPAGLTAQIASTTQSLDIAKLAYEDARKASLSFGASQKEVGKDLVDTQRITKEKIKADLDYANSFRNIALQNVQTAIQEADLISNEEERKKQIKGLKLAEISIQELNALDQLQQETEAKLQAGLISREQYEALRTATMEMYANKRKLIEEDEAAQREKRMQESAKKIEDILNQGLIQTVSAGMQRLGAALAKGPSAFDDFGKAVAGILGDMLVNMGQTMVLASTAWQTFIAGIKTFLPASGIIAGLALMAIGGLLKSAAGAALNPGSGGGGISGGSTEVSSGTQVAANEPIQSPSQQVAVNIHGNVFDTKQTGMHIVDILNQSFQNDGTTLVTGAV